MLQKGLSVLRPMLSRRPSATVNSPKQMPRRKDEKLTQRLNEEAMADVMDRAVLLAANVAVNGLRNECSLGHWVRYAIWSLI